LSLRAAPEAAKEATAVNATQWALNLGILGLMLSQLGTHAASRRRLVLPLAVVGVVAANLLPGTPTAGNDVAFEAAGAAAGLLLGVLAGALMRIGSDAAGRLTITAGLGYAALWTAVIGGRMAFAMWATGPGQQQVGSFSIANHITGPAWTAFFVLMALAMVAARTAWLGAAVLRTR
jgi:hypothetical protein